MAAFREHQFRVNIEFLRASQSGVGRVIRFNHTPDLLPPQLQGRVSLEVWQALMKDVDVLAAHHPYVQKPTAKHYGKWAACFAIGAVVGLFCVDPDAGDYPTWQAEAHQVVQRHNPAFASAGCTLSLQKGRDYWIQVDIDPSVIVQPAPYVPAGGDGKASCCSGGTCSGSVAPTDDAKPAAV